MIKTKTPHYPTCAMTDPGMKGKNNEDRCAVASYYLSSLDRTPVILAVLADGIGGHRAGEVAAQITVDEIIRKVQHGHGRNPVKVLKKAIIAASNEIFNRTKGNEELLGMGATTACALVVGQKLFTASVGDSRIYRLNQQKIYQLSVDHTWIREALDSGMIKPHQVPGHPNLHVIRRYLGGPKPPEVDFRLRQSDTESDYRSEQNQGLFLETGDRILICTDGLTDLVRDEEIQNRLNKGPLDQSIQGLIDLANKRGGHDNITIIGIEVTEQPVNPPYPLLANLPFYLLLLALVIGLAILASWVMWFLK